MERWCGNDKQNVQHILMRLPLLQPERRGQQQRSKKGNMTLRWLLYKLEAVKCVEALWEKREEVSGGGGGGGGGERRGS